MYIKMDISIHQKVISFRLKIHLVKKYASAKGQRMGDPNDVGQSNQL